MLVPQLACYASALWALHSNTGSECFRKCTYTHFGIMLLQRQISTLKKTFKTAKPQNNNNITEPSNIYNSSESIALVYSRYCFCLISAHGLLCPSYKEHPSRAQHTILTISNQLESRFISFYVIKASLFLCMCSAWAYKNSVCSFSRLSETQSRPNSHEGDLGPHLWMWYELR